MTLCAFARVRGSRSQQPPPPASPCEGEATVAAAPVFIVATPPMRCTSVCTTVRVLLSSPCLSSLLHFTRSLFFFFFAPKQKERTESTPLLLAGVLRGRLQRCRSLTLQLSNEQCVDIVRVRLHGREGAAVMQSFFNDAVKAFISKEKVSACEATALAPKLNKRKKKKRIFLNAPPDVRLPPFVLLSIDSRCVRICSLSWSPSLILRSLVFLCLFCCSLSHAPHIARAYSLVCVCICV
jgi:hypothetical protein